jgi:hypothetical protein
MPHSTSVQMLASVGMAGNRSSVFDQVAALYARARSQGQQSGLRSILKGCSRCLHTLDGVDAGGEVRTRRCEGIQVVPITQIQGSESRSSDFDRDFHPLQDRTRERWLSVAVARQRGKSLPPVELIQVGEIYFVRDGHHRISVARALGQQEIEARVLVWQVAGPLPWEAPVTGQGIGLGQLFKALFDGKCVGYSN